MFIKLGEIVELSLEETSSVSAMVSPEILENFQKVATNLKKIAPKADDFLYFSAIMMHSAEAVGLNDDGSPKLTKSGEEVKVGWNTTGGTWKWETNDKSIKPYKNSNGDIFPEQELIKAHKKWIGKPLCIDHKSQSVDHTRGFIVDTYYDYKLKRVVALCALDKFNYPDLARKVSTGYSNNVSMGTAVGRAICTEDGCHRVARTEKDFCDHMRGRTCYGEINVDLNPIELSIVVNGADPGAKIKHIIAAANHLSDYVSSKETELNKLAEKYYKANISFGDAVGAKNALKTIDFSTNSFDEFKEKLHKASDELEKINLSIGDAEEKLASDTNDMAFNQSGSSIEMVEGEDADGISLAPPAQKYASEDYNNSINDLRKVASTIKDKLVYMEESLNKLSNSIKQEENMSGSKEKLNKSAYYQGTEEPTPGQPKYTKDPLVEKDRESEDKHMVGQMDTGPVDGMHPGPDSVGMSELERKKMLARAAVEDRAMRRQAVVEAAKSALESKAYFQNGEKDSNVNTPTPGKVKYPADKLNENLREEDKHMNGQKPFPGVGQVSGLHPSPNSADVSDELKRKQMLRRAGLNGIFKKALNDDGSVNLDKSSWEIYNGDSLLLKASVAEISNNNSELFFSKIATKEFGKKLVSDVKVSGANSVKAMYKLAQATPEAPPAAPEVAAAPEAPADEAVDSGKEGDKKEVALSLTMKIRDLVTDLIEVLRGLFGEKAEMGEDSELGATASEKTVLLRKMRSEVNEGLTEAMKKAIAELRNHEQELDMLVNMYDNGVVTASTEGLVNSVYEDAINEAKISIADGFGLMDAFVKYVRGTQIMVKNAELEAELHALASDDNEDEDNAEDSNSADDNDLMHLVNQADDDLAEVADMLEVDDNDAGMVEVHNPEAAAAVLSKSPEAHVEVKSAEDGFDLTTKAGRDVYRAKLAGDALKVSPMLGEAHPKGGFTTDLDVKPAGDLAKVEDLEEVHDAMLDLANAPPKVRKEAEAIRDLIARGQLDPSELDSLVAEGLDKDAVAYYKKYWAQADGGSEFASELVKEHAKAELDEKLSQHKVKIARAYELAYEMVDRGIVRNERSAIAAQVEDIMKYNDENFYHLKKVIANKSSVRETGRMPQVGLIGNGEITATASAVDEDLSSLLNQALSKTSKRLF